MNTEQLLQKILNLSKTKTRIVIAIAGAPGGGKTTLCYDLKEKLNQKQQGLAADIQMDGFHFDNTVLKEKGLLHKKGTPETFDVYGLIALLNRLTIHHDPYIAIPTFDRSLEVAKAGAKIILPSIKIILIEGNYLLLNHKPWQDLHRFFDLKVMIHTSLDELRKRLIDRWKFFQLSEEQIHQKVYQNDLPNGQFVMENSIAADVIISINPL